MAKSRANTAREIRLLEAEARRQLVESGIRAMTGEERDALQVERHHTHLHVLSNVLSTLSDTGVTIADKLYSAAHTDNARTRCNDAVDSITVACKALAGKIAKMAQE